MPGVVRRGLVGLLAADTLFGLDIDPTAVALTKSALWLETDGTLAITWLDRNIIVGNALAGDYPPALGDKYGGTPPDIGGAPTLLHPPHHTAHTTLGDR